MMTAQIRDIKVLSRYFGSLERPTILEVLSTVLLLKMNDIVAGSMDMSTFPL